MRSKIIVSTLVLSLVFTLMFANVSFAGSDSYVALELDKTTAKVGDIIKATVKINNISNLNGFQVNLRYDPRVLQAVDPDTGEAYTEKTIPSHSTIIQNSEYSPLPLVSHNIAEGLINFGKTYLYPDNYRKSNKPESTGIAGIIGFKVLKDAAAQITFVNGGTLTGSIDGTMLFDWEGKQITSGYTVKQAPKINPSSSYEPLPTYTSRPTTVNEANSPAASDRADNNSPAPGQSDTGDKDNSSGDTSEDSSKNTYIIIASVALGLVLIVIIAVFAVRRKK